MREQQSTISTLKTRLGEAMCAVLGSGLGASGQVRLPTPPGWVTGRARESGKEDLITRELVIKEERWGSKLKGSLEYRRAVARRARRYTSLEVPVIALTPREATKASFDSHMSERVAFQAGRIVREQIISANRAELLEANAPMFGSMDLLVQVRLSQARVAEAGEAGPAGQTGAAVPNVARVALACDLLTQLADTSQANYVALHLLRQEMLTAIFEGYVPSHRHPADASASPPSLQQEGKLRTLQPSSSDFDSLTPYFVQVCHAENTAALSSDLDSLTPSCTEA